MNIPKFNLMKEYYIGGSGGNAFAIMGTMSMWARQLGMTEEEVKALTEKAKSGDYTNLLKTYTEHLGVTFFNDLETWWFK